MAKFRIVPESETVNQLQFMCPGCKEVHALNTTWAFNGDLEKPTVQPSVLVHRMGNSMAIEEFKEYRNELRCHSFITDGKIKFLSDCTHELANQTIELPNIE